MEIADIPYARLSCDCRKIAVVIATTPHDLCIKLFDMIAHSERIYADKITNARKRADFIFARSILRKSLSHALSINPCDSIKPCDIPIARDSYGKPFLHSSFGAHGNIFFNITHSDGLVGVVLAKHGSVGIDLEKISQFQPSEKLPKLLPSDLNAANIPAATLADRWTLREALLKAYGTGFMIPQETVKINQGANQGTYFLQAGFGCALPYCATTIDEIPDYSCSVAVSSASGDAIFSFLYH